MKKLLLFVLLSSALFSTMEVTLKIAAAGIDPFQMTFTRFFWGGLFLLPFAINELKKRSINLQKEDYFYFVILGIINIVISMTFFQFGVIYTKASTAAVIFCTNPVFTMLFAHFLTEEKISRKKAYSLLLNIIGLLFILNPFNLDSDIKGIMFPLISAITFGLYSAYGKRRIKKYGGLAQTSISFILGSGVFLILLIIMNRPIVSGINQSNILLLLYISIFVTGAGYLLYFMAMEKSNASFASLVFFIKPALAPIFAVLILNEHIRFNVMIGIVFILIGSYITLGTGNVLKNINI